MSFDRILFIAGAKQNINTAILQAKTDLKELCSKKPTAATTKMN